MSTRLHFRIATADDLPAVAALVNSAYRGESSRAGWTTETDLLDGTRTNLELLGAQIRPDAQGREQRIELGLDSASGQLMACLALRHEPPSTVYVGMLTVDPRRQAAGLGRALLDRADAVAREWDCRRLRMTVIHCRHELLAYYERRGYRRTGATEPFPREHSGFGVPKVADLHLLELAKVLPPASP